jgi:hypothetical protein
MKKALRITMFAGILGLLALVLTACTNEDSANENGANKNSTTENGDMMQAPQLYVCLMPENEGSANGNGADENVAQEGGISQPPLLYVYLMPEQGVRAVRGGGGWDSGGVSVSWDSSHTLQLRPEHFYTAALQLVHEQDWPLDWQFIGLNFIYRCNPHPPRSITVTRWPAEYLALSQEELEAIGAFVGGEAIELMAPGGWTPGPLADMIPVFDNGRDYVYEIRAVWGQGLSYFAFRLNSGEHPELAQINTYITIRDQHFCTSLTELLVLSTGLTNEDIEPLRYMTNLTSLILTTILCQVGWEPEESFLDVDIDLNAVITDISPLAGLTNLTDLTLMGNHILDISPLAELTNLTRLALNYNRISDLTPLAGLANLTNLLLEGNPISDLSPLTNLTNLEWLALCGFINFSLEPIENLTSLMFLEIRSRQLNDSNIASLAGLTNLQSLNLSHNRISDITPLASLENLRFLDLRDNQISDISHLANLDNLSSLHLNNNPITVWSPVSHLDWVGGRP